MNVARPRLVVFVAVVLIAASLLLVFARDDGNKVTAYFSQTKTIYTGDAVTFRGVRVGTITDIEPERGHVKVTMRVDAKVDLPADARAAVMTRALVAVRAIAIGPGFTGGPKLADGAVIPISRTSVPVEWDEVKTQLTRLTSALGPNGANRNGSVNRLIHSSAHFLRGNGADMNKTITSLSEAMQTLDDNGGEVFATIRNLEVFVRALESSDAQVRSFTTNLATVSAALAQDRHALSASLVGLRQAFTVVRAFLRDHTDLTVSTIKELRSTTSVIAQNRQTLADLMLVAPTTLSNFYNIADPRNGAQNGVVAAENLSSPAQIVCAAILNFGGEPKDCEAALGPLVKALTVPSPPTGTLPPVAVPGTPGSGTDDPAEDLENDLPGILGLGGGSR